MRQLFPYYPEHGIYLNSGTHSFSPLSVIDAMTKYQRKFEENPTFELIAVWQALWERQKDLATFFCANPKDIFIRRSVTEVMQQFILGSKLPTDSEILLSDCEYGAIASQCRYRAERDGLKYRTFSVDLDRISPDTVIQSLRPETRLVVLTHVIPFSGHVLPVLEIARELRKREVLFAVDGAHATGFLPLDFSTMEEIDFYAGSLHKWMLGPKGSAFGWVNGSRREFLQCLHAGWTTYDPHPSMMAFGDGDPWTLKMLESHCMTFAPYLAIAEMLDFHEAHSTQAMAQKIRELQKYAENSIFGALGWKMISPPQDARGPLLTFELPESLRSLGWDLMRTIWEKYKIVIQSPLIKKRHVLRISTHVYNEPAEIDLLVNSLRSMTR